MKNRWLIALSAVGIHLSIGSVYAWSNFTNPLKQLFGWSDQSEGRKSETFARFGAAYGQ
ncbi:hypothetical protein [Geobacillus sp. B4113_201601]|uniref:Uncharacterized protein n=1 Tax=Geobacillus icigianus TaxID=1430331 RepID=A0ABU6BJT5_9BACL|nr:hypothetical protein [Geobacillus icigianus]